MAGVGLEIHPHMAVGGEGEDTCMYGWENDEWATHVYCLWGEGRGHLKVGLGVSGAGTGEGRRCFFVHLLFHITGIIMKHFKIKQMTPSPAACLQHQGSGQGLSWLSHLWGAADKHL